MKIKTKTLEKKIQVQELKITKILLMKKTGLQNDLESRLDAFVKEKSL